MQYILRKEANVLELHICSFNMGLPIALTPTPYKELNSHWNFYPS